jgi:hypothetical protein
VSLGNQFKGDASRVRCSNNREYHTVVSECKDDFKKKRSKRSKRDKILAALLNMVSLNQRIARILLFVDTMKVLRN